MSLKRFDPKVICNQVTFVFIFKANICQNVMTLEVIMVQLLITWPKCKTEIILPSTEQCIPEGYEDQPVLTEMMHLNCATR